MKACVSALFLLLTIPALAHDPELIVGFQGMTRQDASVQALKVEIDQGHVQGVILFRHNVASPNQVRDLISYLKNGKSDLIIAIDQEGGRVQRFPAAKGFTGFPSAAEMAMKDDPEIVRTYGAMANELASCGVTLNLAPCVDLNDPTAPCPVIGALGRSFGDTPTATRLAKIFVQEHANAGIQTSLKHFPGHGSAQGDTHKGFVDTTDHWDASEMDVYRNLFQEVYVPYVMTAHISNQTWGNVPATFSKTMIQDTLIDRLGFRGRVISDDMNMGAIMSQYSFNDALSAALGAGVRSFIYSFNPAASNGATFSPLEQLTRDFWRIAEHSAI